MPGVEITYELTKQDLVEAYTAHRNRNAFRKWVRLLFLWGLGLFAALTFLGFLIKPSAFMARTLGPFWGLVVMWIAVLWLVPRWSMGRQFTKQPGAQGPRTILLDASGTHSRWNGGSGNVEWKNYVRSVEGKNQILLYTSPACFNILPKRGMTPEQLAEVRSLLQANIQTRT